MAVLICASGLGGCGHIDVSTSFFGDGNLCLCPRCGEDHCVELNSGNVIQLTDPSNRSIAETLLASWFMPCVAEREAAFAEVARARVSFARR